MPYVDGQWIPTVNQSDAVHAESGAESGFNVASDSARNITTQFRNYEKSLGDVAPTFDEYVSGDRDAYLGRLGAQDEAKPMVEQFREAALDEARKGNTDSAWQSKERAGLQDRMAEVSAGFKKGLEEGKAEQLLDRAVAKNEHLEGLPLPGETFGSYIERQIILDQMKANEKATQDAAVSAPVEDAVEQIAARYAEATEEPETEYEYTDEQIADEQAQEAFVHDLTSNDPDDRAYAVNAWLGELGLEADSPEADELCTLASGYLADGYEPLVALQLAQASVEL